jgi:hypothetical protein
MSPVTLGQVLAVIRGHRYRYTSEDELQEGIAAALEQAGMEPLREVRLSDRDRIDILVGDVGIEVKVAGSQTHPWDQLKRYAEHEAIGSLLLVTNRWHTMPDEVGGKPLAAHSLVGAGL